MVRWAWSFKAHVGDGREKERTDFPGASPARFHVRGSSERRDVMALSTARFTSRFLDASNKGTTLFRSFEPAKNRSSASPGTSAIFGFSRGQKSWLADPISTWRIMRGCSSPRDSLLSGDITPAYSMLNDEIIERITGYFPNLKVIFLARDPVERAWSQLSMGVRLGRIRPFDVTDIHVVIRNLLHPGVLLRSYPEQDRRAMATLCRARPVSPLFL